MFSGARLFRTVSTVSRGKTVETVKGTGASRLTQMKQGVNEKVGSLIFSPVIVRLLHNLIVLIRSKAMRILEPNRIIFSLTAVCALFIVGVASAGSFQRQPRDVVDHYLLVPDRYLTLGGGAQERDTAIKIRDIKNGYLTNRRRVGRLH